MLRSDTGPEKTSKKLDPLEDLSYKHGYINGSTAILCDLLFNTIPVFDLYSLVGICTYSKLLRNKKSLHSVGNKKNPSNIHSTQCLHCI